MSLVEDKGNGKYREEKKALVPISTSANKDNTEMDSSC